DRRAAPGVALSRKGAKSDTRGRKLRSIGTKARARVGRKRASNSELEKKFAEALEREAATSEVLRVISSSPNDIQPVFNMIVTSAARLCKARYCWVFRFDGKLIHFAAEHGLPPEYIEAIRRRYPLLPGRASAAARAVLTGAVAEIPDVQSDPDYEHSVDAKTFDF